MATRFNGPQAPAGWAARLGNIVHKKYSISVSQEIPETYPQLPTSMKPDLNFKFKQGLLGCVMQSRARPLVADETLTSPRWLVTAYVGTAQAQDRAHIRQVLGRVIANLSLFQCAAPVTTRLIPSQAPRKKRRSNLSL